MILIWIFFISLSFLISFLIGYWRCMCDFWQNTWLTEEIYNIPYPWRFRWVRWLTLFISVIVSLWTAFLVKVFVHQFLGDDPSYYAFILTLIVRYFLSLIYAYTKGNEQLVQIKKRLHKIQPPPLPRDPEQALEEVMRQAGLTRPKPQGSSHDPR